MNGANSYQAEEGMTWQQWIGSKYDTDNAFYINTDNSIYFSEAAAPISANNNQVFASDTIINNYQYDVY